METMTLNNEQWIGIIASVLAVLLLALLKYMVGAVAKTIETVRIAVDDINDAVNHRHKRGPQAEKLYDIALGMQHEMKELTEWKDSHEESGFCWATGDKADAWRKHLMAHEAEQDARITKLERKK